MRNAKKVILLFCLVILILTTAGFYVYSERERNFENKETGAAITAEVKTNVKPGEVKKVKSTVKNENKTFDTIEEIRKEYGRVEVVYLYSGEQYKGFVLSTGEIYKMITVDGIVSIPMKEVMVRNIIR